MGDRGEPLLWGTLLGALILAVANPAVPPRLLMSLYRARPLRPGEAPGLYPLLDALTQHAGLARVPQLYYLASATVNAFATGRRHDAVILVSDGLLRRLDWRELAGVLAHEVAHIAHDDIRVMALADLVSRITTALSLAGQLLLLLVLPALVLGMDGLPWFPILILLSAQTFSTLVQLALSRSREYEADRGAVELSGDPLALASALVKLEQTWRASWEQLVARSTSARALAVAHPSADGRAGRASARSCWRSAFPELRQVICLEDAACADARFEPAPNVVCAADWLTREGSVPADHDADPSDLATLVYTSGTTGRPKGVMLSHRNILWNAAAQLETVPTYHDDILLSFLPLSHAFERTLGYYLPMMVGSCVVYARSLQTLGEDLMTIRPTALISVPRVYEKAYVRIQSKLAQEGRIARALFRKAVAIGWRRFLAGQGRAADLGFADRILWRLLRPLVADKVLARLGGRLRIAISGAAPLSEPVARCFIGLGLNLLEGYGLTEASPTIAGNRTEDNVPGSAGLLIPGAEVRFAVNGELLARSPGVMLGYWKRPEETRQAVDPDGWLHTGDIAEMREGRIYIRERIKDILVMSSGEKLAAGDLERIITADPLFDQALVVGEGKPFVTALLVLEPEAWKSLARELSSDPSDPRTLPRTSSQAGRHRASCASAARLPGARPNPPRPAVAHALDGRSWPRDADDEGETRGGPPALQDGGRWALRGSRHCNVRHHAQRSSRLTAHVHASLHGLNSESAVPAEDCVGQVASAAPAFMVSAKAL